MTVEITDRQRALILDALVARHNRIVRSAKRGALRPSEAAMELAELTPLREKFLVPA